MANDFLKYCRYYKGEKNNPFEYKDRVNNLFWFLEYEYWGLGQDYERWEEVARNYIKNHPDEKNFMTSEAPIEQKGFVMFADANLEKWDPNENHLIFEYGK